MMHTMLKHRAKRVHRILARQTDLLVCPMCDEPLLLQHPLLVGAIAIMDLWQPTII